MTLGFRNEYNCCKSFGCENSGNGDLSLYEESQRLGYPAYYCPKCGAYPPVLQNPPILALAHQIQSKTLSIEQRLLPTCHCVDSKPRWQRFGTTQSATQKLKCTGCGAFSSLPNSVKMAKSLQPILSALVEGVSPEALLQHLSLNRKLYYERLGKLADLLRFVSDIREKHYLKTKQTLCLQTQSRTLQCRSGKGRSAFSATKVWTLSSCESESGYMLMTSDNMLLNVTEMGGVPGLYSPGEPENPVAENQDVFAVANATYDRIFARPQFDELVYCEGKHAQSTEGLLYRPVYASHAHFQNLKLKIEGKPFALVLEHESFIRGAAITAFSELVKTGEAKLYFCHTAMASGGQVKRANVDQCEIKILNWWSEKWYRLPVSNQHGNWFVGMALLTDRGGDSPVILLDQLGARPDWNKHFWQAFEQWLPENQRKKMSHQMLVQWIEIYRYLYNYIFVERGYCTSINPAEVCDIVREINVSVFN